ETIAQNSTPPPSSAISRPAVQTRPGGRPRMSAVGWVVLASVLIATTVLGGYLLRRSESTSGQAGAGSGASPADTLPSASVPAVSSKERLRTASPSVLTLNGGGSTFIYPLIEKWGSVYNKEANVKVNYLPIGSGAGIQQLVSQTLEFCCSDVPLTA